MVCRAARHASVPRSLRCTSSAVFNGPFHITSRHKRQTAADPKARTQDALSSILQMMGSAAEADSDARRQMEEESGFVKMKIVGSIYRRPRRARSAYLWMSRQRDGEESATTSHPMLLGQGRD